MAAIKAPKSADLDARITVKQAAELLGLHERRVHQLVSEGWIKKAGAGYSIRGAVQGYLAFRSGEDRRSSKSASQSRVQEARAQQIELKIIRENRLLVEEARAEGIAVVDQVIGGLKSDLMAIPARVTSDLDIRRKIEAAIDEALAEAARRSEDAASGDEPGDDPLDADDEDDAGSMGEP